MEVHPNTNFLFLKQRAKTNYLNEIRCSDAVISYDWIVPVQSILGKLPEIPLNISIYNVPSELRELNPDSYSPRVVSIGPFFHKQQLAMEEHKWRHMSSLFHRTRDPLSCSEEIARLISGMEPELRGAYAETLPIRPHELSETMLVDSCFILEVFFRNKFKDYTDPSFNRWSTLRRDLALLDNQIPFFVLEKLFETINTMMPERVDSTVVDLALFFFHPKLDLTEIHSRHWSILHLTDLLHVLYEPKDVRMPVHHHHQPDIAARENKGFQASAINLLEAGIEFTTGSASSKLMDLKFMKGVLEIPPLHIYETASSLLKNLIAYEQCNVVGPHHATSYAVVMKSLIRSTRDVELLERKGIIIYDSSCNYGDIVELFNGILKEVVLKDFHFAKLCDNVNKYKMFWFGWKRCKTFWNVRGPRYYGELRKETFANPWKIIAFIAAAMLLILTGLQTFYTVRSYYPH